MAQRGAAADRAGRRGEGGRAAPRILIVAGERSGDQHGADFVRAVRARAPQVQFFGVGGPSLRAAGVETRWDAAALAVIGLREGLGKLPLLWRTFRAVLRAARQDSVAAAVLIDYPGFNLRLAERLRGRGVPVVYYIAPQVWAWRPQRLRRMARCVDEVLVILPFEAPYFEAAGVHVTFVGHPTLDALRYTLPREAARQQLGLPAAATVIGLAPGSRAQEVTTLLPRFLDAAALLAARHPELRFVLPLAGEELRLLAQMMISRQRLPVQVELGRTPEVLRACDVLLVASGTATLEAGILGTPMVIAYVVRPSTYWLARRLVRVRRIGLVNLVAGEGIVPELVQHACTAPRLAEAVGALLPGSPAALEQRRRLAAMAARLGEPGAAGRAAQAFLAFLDGAATRPTAAR